eukprot:GHVT01074162.1.p1 GENE.GHVT01074162.1~~GHVT01074162.1.p1  ORF type:complete len:149 (+),score=40.04 GHVT01074162.1:362-808(+)
MPAGTATEKGRHLPHPSNSPSSMAEISASQEEEEEEAPAAAASSAAAPAAAAPAAAAPAAAAPAAKSAEPENGVKIKLPTSPAFDELNVPKMKPTGAKPAGKKEEMDTLQTFSVRLTNVIHPEVEREKLNTIVVRVESTDKRSFQPQN